MRTAVAFVASPFLTAILVCLMSAAGGGGQLYEALWLFQLALLVGYLLAIVPGLPLLIWLKHKGHVAIYSYGAAGLIAGSLPGAITILMDTIDFGASGQWDTAVASSVGQIQIILYGAIFGAFTAAVFWLIERPDTGTLKNQ